MQEMMTRVNINDFLANFVGIPDDELNAMPDFVKRDIVEDDYETFREFLEGGMYCNRQTTTQAPKTNGSPLHRISRYAETCLR